MQTLQNTAQIGLTDFEELIKRAANEIAQRWNAFIESDSCQSFRESAAS